MTFRIATEIGPRLKTDRPRRPRRPRELRARLEDADHLRLIRALPCLISGHTPAGQAAHIRYANAQFGKAITGIGVKPDDKWTVPLCAWEHTESSGAQHRFGEETWWIERGIDPLQVASNLYACSLALRAMRTDEGTIIQALTHIIQNARAARPSVESEDPR
ncbi:hypothetical protein J2S75_004336 [Ancylobacter polymorphus]|uniref:DUF968 domain-containing protein n=2 Tax=Ancylobacter polymorphus TaxID=223390 RepID=A0ABU0BI62_9HYPH|nr:hypothetical protein [Ancylobacter polymorphus]MDQ0305284.1 hypothetical protein [Ancylobacter polymorphus]